MAVDRITHIRMKEVSRPLKVFFATSLGGKSMMRSLIVTVILEGGASGSGECPTSAAFPGDTMAAMKLRLAGWARDLKGMPIEGWEDRVRTIRRRHASFPMAVSGLETALFRAFLNHRGLREVAWHGGKLREIETDITIPFIPEDPGLFPWVDHAVKQGFRIFKIKVSGHVEEDKKFLSAIFGHPGLRTGDFTFRLDGNQGYTPRSYFQMIDFLEKTGIRTELFEQPLPADDYRGLREIRRHSPIPVILDETVVGREQLKRVISENLAGGVNIKIAKSGILESLDLLAMAKEAGLKLMIGCMTETMVGLSAGISLAAGTGAFDYIDLDGIYFLHHLKKYGAIEIRPPCFFIGE
ncbi:MAG TPA: enolase C-terminal domain-like protein [Syntrophorhabdaceae bacterium]